MEQEMSRIENRTLDQERALYGTRNAIIENCIFAGPADGESALKECRNITLRQCDLHLRYPLWHVEQGVIDRCHITETCRAALWYDSDIIIRNTDISGIKAVRECDRIAIKHCSIISDEFGWYCRDLTMIQIDLQSEYPFLNCNRLKLDHIHLKGKYSFQYVQNVEITDSQLDTKDAFWHAKNVTVTDSVVKGEYLGWYSENLKFVRCKIIGTQPLCYAKGLVLEDCDMIDCDLAFEKSEVHATITGKIDSVKNPESGLIQAKSIGELILEEETTCLIETEKRKCSCF